jgi:hypothetical protein
LIFLDFLGVRLNRFTSRLWGREGGGGVGGMGRGCGGGVCFVGCWDICVSGYEGVVWVWAVIILFALLYR